MTRLFFHLWDNTLAKSADLPPGAAVMGYSKSPRAQYVHCTSFDKRRDRILLMCGPLSMTFYLIFFAGAGFLPPIPPTASAEDVVLHFSQHKSGMKIGVCLIALVAVLWPAYGVSIHHQLSRIPHVSDTTLLLQLINACALGIVFSLIAMFFAAGSYRLDRDPAITQLANDLAWFCWGFCAGPLILQFCAISWAILCDTQPEPLIPHWVAWTSLVFPVWMLFPFTAHSCYSGPFAWDGAISSWGLWGAGGITVGPVTYYVWRLANAKQSP